MAIDPITVGIGLVNTVISRVWPDATEDKKKQAEIIASEIANEHLQRLAQIDVNKTEAASTKLFVSGWRPACGWIGAIALLYASMLEPFMRFVSVVLFGYKGEFPVIDTTITMQVLFGILGLGTMRTIDKIKSK